jgi:hypothetical protein
MTFSEGALGRFWQNVRAEPDHWLWMGALDSVGYGRIYADGAEVKAHRASWRIHFGPIPEGMFVCHTCDIRHCVHPAHLFLGTHADNMRDQAEKGRAARTKLTPSDVVVAREMHGAGWTMQQIANAFDVDRVTISRIVRGLRRTAV